MPSQDAGLSRRSLLQGAATAGAAGLAVTAMGAAAPALAATASGTGTAPAADQAHGHDTAAGPITTVLDIMAYRPLASAAETVTR